MHIYRKKTGFDEIGRIYSIGKGGNFFHQYTRYYAIEYDKLDLYVWPNYHYSIIRILCTANFVNYIKTSNDIDIAYLYNKKIYDNNDINNMANFLFNAMENNFILNYLNVNNKRVIECIKYYYINLIKYENNMKTIVEDLYYLYNNE